MKKGLLFLFIAGSFIVNAQSDNCGAGAPALVMGATCTTTAGSTAGFTDSGVGCSAGNESDDGWYKFVATNTAAQITSTSTEDIVIEIFMPDCATSITGCVDNWSSASEYSDIEGLTVGTTYYIKLHTYANGTGTFNTCVVAAPANDECANATTITPGTPVTGTTEGADQDYNYSQPCTVNGEVWYKFTTPATANCYSLAYDQSSDGCNVVSFFEGACPTGGYTDFQSNYSTNNFNDQGSNESELAGMLPNTTYYIGVSNAVNSNFTFNIRPNTPLAANDQCSGANGIGTVATAADNAVAGCEYSFVSGQDGGIQSTDPGPCNTAGEFPCSAATGFGPLAICALTLENISWYKFTAAANGNITITFAGIECNNGGGGFQSGLFTGASCAALTATGVCAAAASGTLTYTIPAAVAGASYYIAMDGNAGSNCHYLVSGVNVTPLPIELGTFTAQLVESDAVKLNWNTFSERNNDFFTLEKSKDGYAFEFVAEINGAGNSSVERTYSFVDKNPYEGVSYYRLRQTDFNGSVTESSFTEVVLEKSDRLKVEVYPNPSSSSKATLRVKNNESNVVLEITDASGKVVDVQELKTANLMTEMEMSHHFDNGIYFVKATNTKGEISMFKWIIE